MATLSRPLAWITGAGGLIGNYLAQTATVDAQGWEVRVLRRPDLDLTDPPRVQEAFRREQPQLILHCAAVSQTPACQADPVSARRVNVQATALLAQLAERARLVFFSSDLVFDGQRGSYDETAPVNPLSVYAETKVAAEQLILANPRHTVIRTSMNGGISPTGDRGFNEQMRLAWQQGRTVKLFTDEFRSPILALLTARAIWELVRRNACGLYHVGGRERLSRWEIGRLVAARWPQLNPKMEAGSLKDYPGAPRAPDTSLDCRKAQKLLSFPLLGLSEWLCQNPAEVF